jgi:small subunit ribosomal protein S1
MSNEANNQSDNVNNNNVSADDSSATTTTATPVATTSAQEPVSQEEDFGAILEQFEQEQVHYHPGDTVTGKVIGVSERGVVIDFGYKAEGIVPMEEFTSPDGEVQVKAGDEVEVVIKAISGGDAQPVLSRMDALKRKTWEELEKAFEEGRVVTGRVVEKTKGGLKVMLDGVEAFLPGSQVDSRPMQNLDGFVGKDIETKIIKCVRRRNNVVLSRKVITDEVIGQQKAETFAKIDVGYIVDGVVKNLTDYGAFVDIGGIDGLLHVTDMSWGRLQNPSDAVKAGETIQVKILKMDREKEKISLGMKQLVPDPWSSVIEIYPVGTRFSGKVSSVTEYGAFVELEPGVEGLVHVSEMSWSKRSKHPKAICSVGDTVEVQILGVDTEERRISLGMKQLLPNPWETIAGKYRVGVTVQGKVRNITDFGAFVEIEDGIDGLVHVSDISWSRKIKHPKDVLKKGQDVEAVITSIDTDAQRMSLSIKELTPSAWDNFIKTHKAGDVIKGKISRFAGFGVFVEIVDELEGLCHISELSDERVEDPESVFAVGQEVDFKILRIEHDAQKIGLSARAVGKDDEPVEEIRGYSSYTSEAKGGMASLGELANLKFGGSKETTTEEVKAEAPAEVKTEETQEAAEAVEPEQPAEDVPSESGDAGEGENS